MSYNTDILTCFDNLVLLQGCSEQASTSGLYSDNIDIDKDFIDEIRTRKYLSAQDFFNKKFDFALKTTIDKAAVFMQNKFRLATLLDNYRSGQFQDNLTMIAGDGNLKGINFDLCNSDSYLDFYLSEISLQTDYNGDIDVLVYDLLQDKLLDTLTVTSVANEIITIYPQTIYKSSRKKLNLFIGYDSTGIAANTTYLKKGCTTCGGSYSLNNGYEKVNGAKIDPSAQKTKQNLTLIGETGGISIVHSLSCNHENWMCSYANLIAMPALYQYGMDVMDFALTVSPNDRVNTSVTLNADLVRERRNIYRGLFEEKFSTLIDNMKTPSDSKCFVCKDSIREAIILP